MKLRQFINKSRKQKRILIGSFLGIIVVVGSILIYRSYALYKEEKTFNVIRGKVPSFVNGDLEIAIMVDGESTSALPSKGSYDVSVLCDKGAEGYWDYEKWGPYIQNLTENKTKCTINFKNGKYFSDYIKDLSKTTHQVVKVSHEATEQTPELEDYRYVGSNEEVNNYVYFGCEENCTEDNLYRIIGVIPTQSSMDGEYENRVKLIKANNYIENESSLLKSSNSSYPTLEGKGYIWGHNGYWMKSTLQSKVLNDVFWNSLGNYKQYIEDAKWHLGAMPYTSFSASSPNQFYQMERGSIAMHQDGPLEFIGKIGLMYPSDYGYSLGNDYLDKVISTYSGKYVSSSWLYNLESKYYEWFLFMESTTVNGQYYASILQSSGEVLYVSLDGSYALSVRPVFYLKSYVQYKSGDGTKINPYRIYLLK